MKMCPVGAELFHADGRTEVQTDVTKLIVAFRSFAKAPKNTAWCSRCFYVFCMDLWRKKWILLIQH